MFLSPSIEVYPATNVRINFVATKFWQIFIQIFILLEIILNIFNVWQYYFRLKILILAIVPLLFISVCILCEFAMLLDVYILLSPQEEEVHSSSCGNRCTYLAANSSKRLNFLSVIISVCLGNRQKTRLPDKLLHHWPS